MAGSTLPNTNQRTADSKAGEQPSVLDFALGATIWDGVTDASPAVNRMIQSIILQNGNTGGTVYMPGPGIYNCLSPIVRPAGTAAIPLIFRGDGLATVIKRGATIPTGQGLFDVQDGSIRFKDFVVDGNVLTSVGLRYNTDFMGVGSNDPMADVLTQNTSFWTHGGVSQVVFDNVQVQHTGGYSILFDARLGDITDCKVMDCHFENNRPHLFGTFTSTVSTSGTAVTKTGGDAFPANLFEMWINGTHYFVVSNTSTTAVLAASAGTQAGVAAHNLMYGSWTSGILAHGDGRGGAPYMVRRLKIRGNHFKRGTGECIWQHLYGFGSLHEAIQVQDNDCLDNGLDFIQYGGVLGGNCSGNHGRRIGYICSDDTSQSVPRFLNGVEATGIDTSGLCDGVDYSDNTLISVNGLYFSLDGYCRGSVVGNIIRTPAPTDVEYVEDQIGTQGWGLSATPGGTSYEQGFNGGNTSANDGGSDVLIVGNTALNIHGGAIIPFGCRGAIIANNNIEHPATGYSQPPIVLGNLGPADNQRCHDNVIKGNRIMWSPATPQPAIVEMPFGSAYTSADVNWVGGNTIISSNGNAYEFQKDPNSSSTTQVRFSSNLGGLALRSDTWMQREGQASDQSAALRWWTAEQSIVSRLNMQLQSFARGAAGAVTASGTTITWASGLKFNTAWPAGMPFYIAGVPYLIASVADDQHLTLTTSGTSGAYTLQTPLLNVSDNGTVGTGVLATGSRTATAFDDCVATGKLACDSFLAFKGFDASGNTWIASEANQLDGTFAGLRFNHTLVRLEQSVTVSGGARVWTAFGGSVAGSDKWVQYNHAGSFGADANLSWDYTAQALSITGIVSTASLVSLTGYIQSNGGFVSNANSWQGINTATDGALLCGYALAPTASSTGGYVDIAPLGYATFPAPLHGLSGFGATDVLLWASGTNGTSSPVTTIGLMTNAYINAAAGFVSLGSATNIIQAPNGGVTGKFLITTDSLIFIEEAAPALSATGQSRVYMDSTTHKVKISQNNSAYVGFAVVAGSDKQVQYNNSGAQAADANLQWDYTNQVLGVGSAISTAGIASFGTSTAAIQAPNGGVTAQFLIAIDSLFFIQEAAPGLPSSGQSKLYMDSTSHKIRVSENGAAFVNLLSGTVAGSDKQVQYNLSGAFGADSNFVWDYTNHRLGIGVASPTITLDVRSGGSFSQIGAAQTTDYLTFFASDVAGPAIYWNPAKDLRFGKGGSSLYDPSGFVERWRMESAGNFRNNSSSFVADQSGNLTLAAALQLTGIAGSGNGLNVTVNTDFNSVQTAGGMYAAKGFTSDQSFYPKGFSSSSSLASPGAGYGGLSYKGGAIYWYWNGTAWAQVDFSVTGGVSSISPGTLTGAVILAAGTGLSVAQASQTITYTNTGVTSATAGTGVSVSGATGAVTFSIGQSVATSAAVTFNQLTLSGAGAAQTIVGTGTSILFQTFNGATTPIQMNGNGVVSCQQVNVAGNTAINSSNTFVGAGIDCRSNGAGATGFNVWNGASYDFGQTVTLTIASTTSQTFEGGVLINFATVSDARLKNVLMPFTRGVEALKGIRPVVYQWTDAAQELYQTSKEKVIGFIAQEIQAAMPEATFLDRHSYIGIQREALLAAVVIAVQQLDDRLTRIAPDVQ